jgi:hypothetical protein
MPGNGSTDDGRKIVIETRFGEARRSKSAKIVLATHAEAGSLHV